MGRLGWAITLLAVVLFIPASQAMASNATDADFWKALTPGQQSAAVMAAINAYQVGIADGIRYSGESFSQRDVGVEKVVVRGHVRFTHTFGYYIAAITDFYDTHPNGRNASIGWVLSCLGDNAYHSCNSIAEAVTSP